MTEGAPGAEKLAEEEQEVAAIIRRGPRGAFLVAGIATAIVVGIYFAFYLLIYLPRGAVQ